MRFEFYLILSLIFVSIIGNAQKKVPNLNLYKQIDSMAYYDQLHRKERLKYKSYNEYLSKVPASIRDSIWKRIEYYDSINFIKYVEIVNTYGFIEKSKQYKSAFFEFMLLHYISHNEVKVLQPLLFEEVQAHRMSAITYAEWYDRYLFQICKKRQLYGEYLSKNPCVDDLIVSNEARRRIGLKPLKMSHCE